MEDENKVIYPELSYQIIGILFSVWNDIGYGHKEIFYQKAIAKIFKDKGINFKEQERVRVNYRNENLGVYILDFLVDNKIILEIKKREFFSKKDIEELYSYLKAKNLKLGIIAHFTSRGVRFKRVLNIK
jgi:GxxExxY protein